MTPTAGQRRRPTTSLNPTASVLLLAVRSTDAGDVVAAERHLARARELARSSARRDRHVVEIAALVVTGHRDRACGLSSVHVTEFPDDAALLTQLLGGTA